MEMDKHDALAGPWILPQFEFGPTRYFADLRLKHFRAVDKPHNYIDFASAKGQRMCRQTGVVVCPQCGVSAIAPTMLDREKLRCVWCLELIVPLFCL